MKTIGIIPARYKSSRFPGKPLVKLLNKPMIIWVAELSAKALGKENIYVATDDIRIYDTVIKHNYNCIMTSENCLTGTDRIAEVAEKIDADIYINIQGDEPCLNYNDIIKIRDEKIKSYNYIINAMTKISENEDPESRNIPKVTVNRQNELIYMSRLAIPGFKDIKNKPPKYLKQVCIYAFSKEELLKFKNYNKKGIVEAYEDIEILRFFELAIPIKMVYVEKSSYAIDIPEDIPNVENTLKVNL